MALVSHCICNGQEIMNYISYDNQNILCFNVQRLADYHIRYYTPNLRGTRSGTCTKMVQAPVPLTVFRSNSKLYQSLPCSGLKCTLPITTKFCTRHDSVTGRRCDGRLISCGSHFHHCPLSFCSGNCWYIFFMLSLISRSLISKVFFFPCCTQKHQTSWPNWKQIFKNTYRRVLKVIVLVIVGPIYITYGLLAGMLQIHMLPC